ncbi:MAG: DUF488 family protein [Desulfurococcales archaeon]|nr:DUF488 family protein [Desulfurococcales archaeon]
MTSRIVYTIGHSNRSLEEFLDIIKKYRIEVVVDVRRWPKSRKYPRFNRQTLEEELERHGITYVWMGDTLGGYRRPSQEDLKPKCFKSPGFQAYARYLTTSPQARKALEDLASIVESRLVAVMCAERFPWRCHRKLISDWLTVRGFTVLHIIDTGHLVEHRLTRCARVVNGELTYIF